MSPLQSLFALLMVHVSFDAPGVARRRGRVRFVHRVLSGSAAGSCRRYASPRTMRSTLADTPYSRARACRDTPSRCRTRISPRDRAVQFRQTASVGAHAHRCSIGGLSTDSRRRSRSAHDRRTGPPRLLRLRLLLREGDYFARTWARFHGGRVDALGDGVLTARLVEGCRHDVPDGGDALGVVFGEELRRGQRVVLPDDGLCSSGWGRMPPSLPMAFIQSASRRSRSRPAQYACMTTLQTRRRARAACADGATCSSTPRRRHGVERR